VKIQMLSLEKLLPHLLLQQTFKNQLKMPR
jgi:hypothetical protein